MLDFMRAMCARMKLKDRILCTGEAAGMIGRNWRNFKQRFGTRQGILAL